MTVVVAPTGETRVNSTTAGSQINSSVTRLADGGWVVTWESADGDSTGIYQQRYNAQGNPVLGEIRVNAATAGTQSEASITALADGG